VGVEGKSAPLPSPEMESKDPYQEPFLRMQLMPPATAFNYPSIFQPGQEQAGFPFNFQ
jgi:hypothetical protein